jgi:hypothetical protein
MTLKMVDNVVSRAKHIYGPKSYGRIIDTNGGRHSYPGSLHYLGLAIDFYIEGLSLYEMFMLAVEEGFDTVGFYPYHMPKNLHVDNRVVVGREPKWYFYDLDGNGFSTLHNQHDKIFDELLANH